MSKPAGYFDHEQKIKTHAQMLETLKSRTRSAVGQSPKSLQWLDPVRNKDGSGHQNAAGTLYTVRKAQSKDVWIYWAWHDKKLLGYAADLELAKSHCEAHNLRST